MSQYNIPNGIILAHQRTSLAFADDIVFFAKYLEMTFKQMEVLNETSAHEPGYRRSHLDNEEQYSLMISIELRV